MPARCRRRAREPGHRRQKRQRGDPHLRAGGELSGAFGKHPSIGEVADRVQGGGVSQKPPPALVHAIDGRQPVRRIEQLGRTVLSTAQRCLYRPLLDLGSGRVISFCGAQRQVVRPLLRVVGHGAEPPMQPTAAGLGCRPVDSGRQQRVRKAQPSPVADENARLLRLDERSVEVERNLQSRRHRPDRRTEEHRRHQQHRSSGGGQASQPGGQELMQARRHRKRIGEASTSAFGDQLPGDLEGKERVTSTRRGDANEQRSRKRRPEAFGDQVVQHGDAQRTGHDAIHSPLGERAFQTQGKRSVTGAPPGQDQADAGREPPCGKRQRSLRGGVHPMHVVHRHNDRRVGGEDVQHTDQRHRRRPRVDRLIHATAQQRRSQGALLRRRQQRSRIIEHATQQI